MEAGGRETDRLGHVDGEKVGGRPGAEASMDSHMEATCRPADKRDGNRSAEGIPSERQPMPCGDNRRSSRRSTSVGPAEGTEGATQAPNEGDKETPSFLDVIEHVLSLVVELSMSLRRYRILPEHRCSHSSKKAFACGLLFRVLGRMPTPCCAFVLLGLHTHLFAGDWRSP